MKRLQIKLYCYCKYKKKVFFLLTAIVKLKQFIF